MAVTISWEVSTILRDADYFLMEGACLPQANSAPALPVSAGETEVPLQVMRSERPPAKRQHETQGPDRTLSCSLLTGKSG